jgi:hypothetical protein
MAHKIMIYIHIYIYIYIYVCVCKRGAADTSLVQKGRKQATATKIGIYST